MSVARPKAEVALGLHLDYERDSEAVSSCAVTQSDLSAPCRRRMLPDSARHACPSRFVSRALHHRGVAVAARCRVRTIPRARSARLHRHRVRPGNLFRVQRFEERRGVHEVACRGVDETCVVAHEPKTLHVHEVACLGCGRTVQRNESARRRRSVTLRIARRDRSRHGAANAVLR